MIPICITIGGVFGGRGRLFLKISQTVKKQRTLQFLLLIITAALQLLLQLQSSQKQLQSEIQEGELDDIKLFCPKMDLSILSFTATIERLYF